MSAPTWSVAIRTVVESRSHAMKYDPEKLLFAVDLAGTLLFAIEGATAAISGNLDLLGLMVLAFATALTPDYVLDLGRAAARVLVRSAGGRGPLLVGRDTRPSGQLLDAAGLALFAVAGTQKALIYKMHPFIAVLLGTITGVGGGTIRDMFLARIPTVLRADVYATAAMAGSETWKATSSTSPAIRFPSI